MVVTSIEMDGFIVEITKKPIKNFYLRVYPPDGAVRVSAPLQYSERKIQQQLASKRDWIEAQRVRIQKKSHSSTSSLSSEGKITYLGRQYPIAQSANGNLSGLFFKENQFIFCGNWKDDIKKQKALEHWYREQMKSLLPSLIAKWTQIIPVHIHDYSIKKMKSRWGSCNPRTKNICLNLNLMIKPLICLEYVLVHELIHLLEPSHNQRFYRFMSQFMPEWKVYKQLLEFS